MEVAIRTASPVEAPVLAGLHLRVAAVAYDHVFPPEAPAPSVDEVASEWSFRLDPGRDRRTEVFVALDAAEVIGVVVAEADPSAERLGRLSRLYVDDRWWGRGVGTRLYEAAATLWVLEANWRARDWYERLGWEATGQRKPVWAPGGIDDIGYRLALGARHQLARPAGLDESGVNADRSR